jgi:hypothetical protein
MENEIWRDVVGYEGWYKISSFGRVQSLDKTIINCNGMKYEMKGRLLKPILSRYFWINLVKNTNRKRLSIHRLVAIAFIPNPECKPYVNHINGIKTDNRVVNLEWVTPQENDTHASINCLKASGERSGNSRLTYEIILCIRSKYIPRKYTNLMISKEFKISYHHAQLITSGVLWPERLNKLRQLET